MWHACIIGEGWAGWEKHDTMTCDHRDACKELRHLDPTSPPLDYICMGFPKTGTPSSSEKEPMPQGSQESSKASPHHSQHPKKKKPGSAKRSSGEGSLSKVQKKSKCHKEMPKKEKHHWWDKADKSKSDKSHKK